MKFHLYVPRPHVMVVDPKGSAAGVVLSTASGLRCKWCGADSNHDLHAVEPGKDFDPKAPPSCAECGQHPSNVYHLMAPNGVYHPHEFEPRAESALTGKCGHCGAYHTFVGHTDAPAPLGDTDIEPHDFESTGPDYDDCRKCNMVQNAMVHGHGAMHPTLLPFMHHQLTNNGRRDLGLTYGKPQAEYTGPLHVAKLIPGTGRCTVCGDKMTASYHVNEPCPHPNGFGPYGCAGCGATADNDPDADATTPATGEPVTMLCPVSASCRTLSFRTDDALVAHMRQTHGMNDAVMGPYVDEPWLSTEPRSAWKERTFPRRYAAGLAHDAGTAYDKRIEAITEEYNKFMADNAPAEPHLFVLPSGTQVDNARYCALAGCDKLWSDVVYDPVGVKPSVFDRLHTIAATMNSEAAKTDPTAALCMTCGDAKHWHNQDSVSALDTRCVIQGCGCLTFIAPGTPEFGEPLRVEAPDAATVELAMWWSAKAKAEIGGVVPKAVEYGATDLRDIGRDLADCMGRTVTDEEAAELGVFFYLRGKMSRWVDAVKRGDRPSDDTIYDIGVYCRMAQRIRDTGGWPGKQ